MRIDSDQRPKPGLETLPKRDLVRQLAANQASRDGFLEDLASLQLAIRPLEQEREAIDARLEPLRNAGYRIQEAVRRIDHQIAATQDVLNARRHKQQTAQERRVRKAFEQEAMTALEPTLTSLEGSSSPALSRLGAILKTASTDRSTKKTFPGLIETNLTQVTRRNNKDRIRLSSSEHSDGARVILADRGVVAIMYHPKASDSDTVRRIIDSVENPEPNTHELNGYTIGFMVDESGESLSPFVFANPITPRRPDRYESWQAKLKRKDETQRIKNEGFSIPVPLDGAGPEITKIASKVDRILLTGQASYLSGSDRIIIPSPLPTLTQ